MPTTGSQKFNSRLNVFGAAILSSAHFFNTSVASSSEVCNLVANGTSFDVRDPILKDCDFILLDESFSRLLEFDRSENDSEVVLLKTDANPLFHEGPVLFQEELFFTTNRLPAGSSPTWGATAPFQPEQTVNVMKMNLSTLETVIVAGNSEIPMANGMTKTPDRKNILTLSQGFNGTGGAIYEFNRITQGAKPVLDTIFGAQFNALNDIQATEDGILFFSDPVYGFEQGFRTGKPNLGSNVYRYDTATKTISTLAIVLQRPNGVALYDGRPYGKGCTIFLSDTGFESEAQAPRGFDGRGDSMLYSMKDPKGCFEPQNGPWVLQPLVPASASGIQDGMHVHQSTGLLFYCDTHVGLFVWSIEQNRVHGIIPFQGGCTQVAFDEEKEGVGAVYILAETKLWKTKLNFVSVDKWALDGKSNNLDKNRNHGNKLRQRRA